MDLALILSVVAVAVAVGSFTLSVANWRRGRPKLRVTAGYYFDGDNGPIYLEVAAVNVRNAPTTVLRLGLASSKRGRHPFHRKPRHMHGFGPQRPQLLGPGERTAVHIEKESVGPEFEQPPTLEIGRAYAMTADGRFYVSGLSPDVVAEIKEDRRQYRAFIEASKERVNRGTPRERQISTTAE